MDKRWFLIGLFGTMLVGIGQSNLLAADSYLWRSNHQRKADAESKSNSFLKHAINHPHKQNRRVSQTEFSISRDIDRKFAQKADLPSIAEKAANKQFQDWCFNAESLSPYTKEMIYKILHYADTFDCDVANQRLKSLQELRLVGNFDDFTPLKSLKSITKLEIINQNKAGADLQPLSEMPQLTYLSIRGYVQNITPLSNLPGLTYLNLSGNEIQDIKPLAKLTNLTYLDLVGNYLSGDLTPLSKLTKLTTLRLKGRCVNVSPLQSLTALEVLHLGSSGITDIVPLAKLTNLRSLWLFNNPIKDIRPLASLTQLVELDLRETEVQDQTPLSELKNLETLRIEESLGLRHAGSKRRRCG